MMPKCSETEWKNQEILQGMLTREPFNSVGKSSQMETGIGIIDPYSEETEGTGFSPYGEKDLDLF